MHSFIIETPPHRLKFIPMKSTFYINMKPSCFESSYEFIEIFSFMFNYPVGLDKRTIIKCELRLIDH